MKLLFVDDDEHFLEGIGRHLSVNKNSIDYAVCTNAKQARDLLANEQFDAIIADLRMPGEDGDLLLQYVRKKHPSMVRIILTALEDEESLQTAKAVAHATFIKPCDIEDIIGTVIDIRKGHV
jgi:DNA-binding NtrC family response regulator